MLKSISLKEFLVFVPSLSLFSASIYLTQLSRELEFLPHSIFTMKDHFDKAVDFIVPVFFSYGLSLGLGFFLGSSNRGEDDVDDTNNKIEDFFFSKFFYIPALILALSFATLFLPKEIENVKFLFLAAVSPLLVSDLSKLRPNVYTYVSENSRLTLIAPMIMMFLFWGITSAYHTNMTSSKRSHFSENNIAIIEIIENGYIAIQDGRYVFLNKELKLLDEGRIVKTTSNSILCNNNFTWACQFKIVFDEN